MADENLTRLYARIQANISLKEQAEKNLKKVNVKLKDYDMYNEKRISINRQLVNLRANGINDGISYTVLENRLTNYHTKMNTNENTVNYNLRVKYSNQIAGYNNDIKNCADNLISYINQLLNSEHDGQTKNNLENLKLKIDPSKPSEILSIITNIEQELNPQAQTSSHSTPQASNSSTQPTSKKRKFIGAGILAAVFTAFIGLFGVSTANKTLPESTQQESSVDSELDLSSTVSESAKETTTIPVSAQKSDKTTPTPTAIPSEKAKSSISDTKKIEHYEYYNDDVIFIENQLSRKDLSQSEKNELGSALNIISLYDEYVKNQNEESEPIEFSSPTEYGKFLLEQWKKAKPNTKYSQEDIDEQIKKFDAGIARLQDVPSSKAKPSITPTGTPIPAEEIEESTTTPTETPTPTPTETPTPTKGVKSSDSVDKTDEPYEGYTVDKLIIQEQLSKKDLDEKTRFQYEQLDYYIKNYVNSSMSKEGISLRDFLNIEREFWDEAADNSTSTEEMKKINAAINGLDNLESLKTSKQTEGKEAATATPTPTEAPTATPTPTEAPTATPTPTEAPTATPTPTEAPTATPTPTEAPTATPTPTEAAKNRDDKKTEEVKTSQDNNNLPDWAKDYLTSNYTQEDYLKLKACALRLAIDEEKNGNSRLAADYRELADTYSELAHSNKQTTKHDEFVNSLSSDEISSTNTTQSIKPEYDIGTVLHIKAGLPHWEDSEKTKGPGVLKNDMDVQICAFAAIDENGNYIPETRHMSLEQIKAKYPDKKIMVLLGGPGKSNKFEDYYEDPESWLYWVSANDISISDQFNIVDISR